MLADYVVVTSKASDQAHTFMHELGHNFGLQHSQEKDGTDSDPNVNPTGSETVKSTVMYWQEHSLNPIDYLDEEWNALQL